jgi:hypothetical protein
MVGRGGDPMSCLEVSRSWSMAWIHPNFRIHRVKPYSQLTAIVAKLSRSTLPRRYIWELLQPQIRKAFALSE